VESKREPERSPFEPDHELASRAAKLARAIETRLFELQLPRLKGSSIGAISGNLSSLWESEKELVKDLEGFLESPTDDMEALSDYLVDLQTRLEVMRWSLQGVRKPLSDLIGLVFARIERDVAAPNR